jgi:hypothetical protein
MVSEQHVPSTIEELLKFQANGEEFDPTCDFSGKFIRDKDGLILLNFGKHKGQFAHDHLDFVYWMLGKDFTRDTLLWAQGILEEGQKA